ncbi:hypothetical protein L6R29_13245 [Myxococcota bacterium]|nr:hypothetical protein [Myxococcota bacterium]
MSLDTSRKRALLRNLLFNLIGVFFGIGLFGYGVWQLNAMIRSRWLSPLEQGYARLLSQESLPYEREDSRYKLSFLLTNSQQKTRPLTIFDPDLFHHMEKTADARSREFSYALAAHPTKTWVFLRLGAYRHKPKPLPASAWILMIGVILCGVALWIAAFRSVKERRRQLVFEQVLADNEARKKTRTAEPLSKVAAVSPLYRTGAVCPNLRVCSRKLR